MLLDLARPYAGPRLRPWQWAVGLVTVAVLWSWLRARGRRRPEALAFTALAAFLVPVVVDHGRVLQADGILYYAHLRSLLFDGDLDETNDLRLFGYGEHVNVLPIGAPLLQAPLVLPVHVARQAGRLFGLPPPDGTEPVYQAAVSLASIVYGAAALFLLPGALRRWAGLAAAFWATVLSWIGSPLRFYLSVLPGFAHAPEFLAVVLVLRSYLRLRDRPDLRAGILAGAACGLAFLLRSQDGLLLLLPGLELAIGLLRGRDRDQRRRAALGLAAAFLVVALPQLVVWQVMFGAPLLVPHTTIHGSGFILPEPQLAGALVSPRGGLFTSHPCLLLALAGLLVLCFRDGRYAVPALVVTIAMWVLNASIFDWYQVRRYTGVVPLLAPGLAVVLARLARPGPVLPALLALACLRYDQAVDALRRVPGDPAPVRSVLREAADRLVADAYGLLEPAAPGLAVRLAGAYAGEAILEGPVSYIDMDGDAAVLRVPIPARHLSAPAVEDGEAARWVSDRETRLFLPLAWRGPVVLVVRARALETVEPQFVEAFWNDRTAGRRAMAPAWADYRFEVPADAVRLGTNELVLRFDRAPNYRRVRGDGPKEVRPAALAWIALHRQR